jgi:hypothetical protein
MSARHNLGPDDDDMQLDARLITVVGIFKRFLRLFLRVARLMSSR